MNATPASPGLTIRRLMRRQPRVALGTAMRGSGGAPYVSLAFAALDHDAAPLLLLSDLADHSRNLKEDGRVSLLFDGTLRAEVPLAGERATVQGRIAPTALDRHRERYVARHPDAADYLGFKDFVLYRVEVERAHLVAGFGRIHWIEAGDVLLNVGGAAALAEAEPGIVRHMNEDHAEAVGLYATALLGRAGTGWIMTGVDPEGADLRRGGETARLLFDEVVHDAEAARVELVRLARRARSGGGGGGGDAN